jgi:hypothetical protein
LNKEGGVMTLLNSSILAAGAVLVFCMAGNLSSPALAEENAPREAGITLTAPASTSESPEVSASNNKKVVVKLKKRHKNHKKNKNRVAKMDATTEAEPIPGNKLTLKQVMDILKSTRDLSGKNLSGLNLVGFNLTKCNLKGVDLSHANLERADLEESNLDRADLSGANLKMANLRMSGMTGICLENAVLDGAVWKDGRVCTNGSTGQCKDLVATYPPK